MRMKKIAICLIALLLSVSCMTSCGFVFTTLSLLFGDDYEMTPFEEMTYVVPDFETLENKIEEMSQAIKAGEESKKQMANRLSDIADRYYYEAYTMENLSFLRYCEDVTSAEARDEYFLISSEVARIRLLLDELYYLCADSPYAEYLEKYVMGVGFFDDYEGGPFTYPEELIALMNQESALISQYSALMAERTVEYQGVTYTQEDMMAITDGSLYQAVRNACAAKYNAMLGEIYVDLVAVRRAIATYMGYSSYADYAYENLYQREYTPLQANTYLKGIRQSVVPVFEEWVAEKMEGKEFALVESTPENSLALAERLVGAMSDRLSYVFTETLEKNLCSVNASPTKYYGSFQTYLWAYDTPYFFVNGDGSANDILTVIHEFGHFASAYYNYGAVGSNDETEVASQTLQLMSLSYLETVMNKEDAKNLRDYALTNTFLAVIEQGAYAAFEEKVYNDVTLTVEECNAYFNDCVEDFGLAPIYGEGGEAYWVFLHHLFESPLYVIGYSVSMNVAMQICEQGTEQGMETYEELIQLAYRYDFLGNLTEVGLKDPLLFDNAKVVADFMSKELAR